MALPVVIVTSGGYPMNRLSAHGGPPVTLAAQGLAVTEAPAGYGTPMTFVTEGGSVVLPGPVAWTPAALGTALRAWYKFDTLTGSNGDPQGTVLDASGNGFTLQRPPPGSGTTNQPILAVAEQNGKNTLRFSGAQSYNLSPAIFSGATAGSVYFIYKVVSETVNNGLFKFGTNSLNCSWPYTDQIIVDDFGSTTRVALGNPSVPLTAYHVFSLYSAENDKAFYIDGGTGGSGGGTSPFFSTSTNVVAWNSSVPDLWLGANKTGAGNASLNGWIAEFVFTNAKQSTVDRQKMEGYLAHKWGLTGNLSASHPYKSAPP